MKNMKSNRKKMALLVAIPIVIAAATLVGITSGSVFTQAPEKQITVTSTLIPLDISDLSQNSTYIVVGTVADILAGPTQYDEKYSTTRAFTDVVINVDEELTGTYKSNQITVRTIGGMVGDTKIVAEEEAKFTKGEKILLFIKHVDSSTLYGDSFVVFGMEQGKYEITDGKAFGQEYPQGIPLENLKTQVKAFRG